MFVGTISSRPATSPSTLVGEAKEFVDTFEGISIFSGPDQGVDE